MQIGPVIILVGSQAQTYIDLGLKLHVFANRAESVAKNAAVMKAQLDALAQPKGEVKSQ